MNESNAHPSILKAIERLDNCISLLRKESLHIDPSLYGDMLSQGLIYAQYLSIYAGFGVHAGNAIIRDMMHEIDLFCELIEQES